MGSLKLFVIGATGYIGGSALTTIYKQHPNIKVTALVRSEKDDVPVAAAFGGARIVRGDFTSLGLIETESADADVVLNGADADGMEVVNSILSGQKRRFEASGREGRKPVLIQTSGTGVVCVGNDGSFIDAHIVNDNVVQDLKDIDIEQPHRRVDLRIIEANDEGYVDAYIISPSAIYGKGTGPVRTLTAQIPTLIRTAVRYQQVMHVGQGKNVWNFVHIEDLADLYALVFELALDEKRAAKAKSGFERYYFGSVDLHAFREVTKELAPILKARGRVNTLEVGSVKFEDEPRMLWTANNSRSRADRGFALGWKPRENGVWATLEETVDAVLAEQARVTIA